MLLTEEKTWYDLNMVTTYYIAVNELLSCRYFDTKEECVSELSKSPKLVTNKNTALDCIHQTNRKVDITINDN